MGNSIRWNGISEAFDSFENGFRHMGDYLHFAALNCWAKQPNTNRANIIHNTVLF